MHLYILMNSSSITVHGRDMVNRWACLVSPPLKARPLVILSDKNYEYFLDLRQKIFFTCSTSAGQHLMRIVVVVLVVGTKLNYLRRCGVLVPLMSFFFFLLMFFVVGQLKFLNIAIDKLMGHGVNVTI